jgi:hypothetical protein
MEVGEMQWKCFARHRCIGTKHFFNDLMIREAILMALMALMIEEKEAESLVNSTKDLFRSWGDQVAGQSGNGVLVSMWYVLS